jgi:hypothetical protein
MSHRPGYVFDVAVAVRLLRRDAGIPVRPARAPDLLDDLAVRLDRLCSLRRLIELHLSVDVRPDVRLAHHSWWRSAKNLIDWSRLSRAA